MAVTPPKAIKAGLDRVRGKARRSLRRSAMRILDMDRKSWIVPRPNPSDPELLPEFRLFAVLGTWMEEDIVEATVQNALTQGVEAVYLVDNNSSDQTVERAVAAGATLVESFKTRSYDERLRILLMNAVVARASLKSDAKYVWWLWLDADEFPEGPDGLTIREYLSGLDRSFRLVGSSYFNHYPTEKPHYISGFHPLDFQPDCSRYLCQQAYFCGQAHYKHPLQRFDAGTPFLAASVGFHTATTQPNRVLAEPDGGIVTHHVPYREEGFTRARLERLTGTTTRNAINDSIGNTGIRKRFESLEAVYSGRWSEVDNQVLRVTQLGVELHRWPDLDKLRRWYDLEDIEAAKADWRIERAS
ncbi:MAG TPA: glycosyltransferase family 2 protein [Acidimicrobiales bacterium]|nr:glycosyltransferase family 2 protein [Acidimicrobiales bacterium]